MNILFLTRKFAPQNYIGAIRPTKIAKYLTRLYNCQVDVICMRDSEDIIDPMGQRDISSLHHIEIMKSCKWITKIKEWYAAKASKIKANSTSITTPNSKIANSTDFNLKNKITHIARNILYLISILDSYIYAKRVIMYLNKNKEAYSAFFSTTYLVESYIVGRWLKKNNPNIRWIYDLRDPIQIDSYPGTSGYIMRRILKKTVKSVDEVTGVSKACLREFEELGQINTHVVRNGFDEEDISSIDIDKITQNTSLKNDSFKIVYTGSLYDGKRDVTPLLLLLLDLAKESKINLQNIELHYAGKDFHVLENSISKIGINIKAINHGFIPRDQSISLQLSANVLLLLSWNNIGDTGVVTGKFYEYLMMGRPIICLIKGNLPNSLLRQMIEETNTGTCYEEAATETHNIAKEYLSCLLNNKYKAKCPPKSSKCISQYNYKNIAGEIFHLCLNK
ncbi:MAG: glycosyltransferase family 4 protein [Bacteroides sp.]|nr:glycosyltransferase family 4 protein [Bacteroides sp.]